MDYRKATKEIKAEMAMLRKEHRQGWLVAMREALLRGPAHRTQTFLLEFYLKELQYERARSLRYGWPAPPWPKGGMVSINKGQEPIIPERLKNPNS